MSDWSLQCDVWLSRYGTPENPSPRMAFAAGWNARKDIEEIKPSTSTNSAMVKLPQYGTVEAEFLQWWNKEGQGVDKLTYKNMHKFFDIIKGDN